MSSFIELQDLVQVVLRRWWIVVTAAIVAALIAFVFSVQQTPVYRATASLAVGRTVQAANVDRYDFQISQELALTYADIAQRQPVLQATVDALQLDQSWTQLRRGVTVNPVENTQLLEISVEAESPETASQIADEIARQLILLSPSSPGNNMDTETYDFISERLEHLQANIEAAQDRIDMMESDLTGMSVLSVEALRQRQEEIEALDLLIATWETAYGTLFKSLQDEQSSNYLAVVEPAQATNNPIRPRTRLNVLIAMLAGAAAGLSLIFWREYSLETFRSSKQAEQMLGLPSLGAISRRRGGLDDLFTAGLDSTSSTMEDCRMLRSKLLSLMKNWPRKVVLVTSPSEAEGKSVIVASLGIMMARFGLKTVIVDANLRNPTQNTLFRVHQIEGLTEELRSSDSSLSYRLKKVHLDNLRLLTSGRHDVVAPDRLGSPRMYDLLTELDEMADIVLVDASDAVNLADALILAPQVDGVLLVIDAQTHRDVAALAVSNLQMTDANIVGFVMNRVSAQDQVASLSAGNASVTSSNTVAEAPSSAQV